MNWLLVAIIVVTTTVKDILQAIAMRRHGEIHDFRPDALGKLLRLLASNRNIVISMVCSGISFFAFLRLVSIADLSFAVPATSASYVFETVLAKYILKEQINWLRWIGAMLVACGVALLSL
jgi:drug/metabolite transporter (DMT)-like permease